MLKSILIWTRINQIKSLFVIFVAPFLLFKAKESRSRQRLTHLPRPNYLPILLGMQNQILNRTMKG